MSTSSGADRNTTARADHPQPSAATDPHAAAGGIAPGRTVVLEPTPPGTWRVILGVCLAALGPLFGFLIGASRQRPEAGTASDPLALALFVGIVVGGFGLALAILGGLRLWRHFHEAGEPPEDSVEGPEPSEEDDTPGP